MAGNAANVKLWTEADVLVYDTATNAFPTADIPDDASDPWVTTTGKWTYLGMLVGDAGIDQAREWDEKDIPAWGYGTIIIARKNFKMTMKVSALEDNAIMQKILWPASTADSYVVPHPLSRFIAFEKRDADGNVDRLISMMPADLWVPSLNDKEGDANVKEITVRVFPNGSEELFTHQASV